MVNKHSRKARHCERSEAICYSIDCFASLAMTVSNLLLFFNITILRVSFNVGLNKRTYRNNFVLMFHRIV